MSTVNDRLKTLRVGDVIKSTRTLEVVDYSDMIGRLWLKDVQNDAQFAVYTDGNHGSWSFEMVKKAAPKVGDTLNEEQYDALPLGSVLKWRTVSALKTSRGFVFSDGDENAYLGCDLANGGRLVYLPS